MNGLLNKGLLIFHTLRNLFQTVKYLKFKQIFYRLFYASRKQIRQWTGFSYPLSVSKPNPDSKLKSSQPYSIILSASIPSTVSLVDVQFTFLNLSHDFEKTIDWNYSAFGKLWTYNLNYFDYLNQSAITRMEGLHLIQDFIDKIESSKDGLEPFPISLRGINWIKFIVRENIKDKNIDDCLYAQYVILMDNLEYHLLGNHLLENGFSLLFGAYYFKDETFYQKALHILTKELKEQVLEDGAHFELSPMYHQIMLYRVIDCINLLQHNAWKNDELLRLIRTKAALMLGWLNSISFENGNIPLLNDSAQHIAPTTHQLNDYADRLNINFNKQALVLSDSGCRIIKNDKYECVIDVGNIGPDYIPGHAHSDTFNFELYVGGKPLVVDTGLSTYEVNERRFLERSTASHNTVEIGELEQSEVWGGFRVASRAKIISLEENEHVFKAVHDGYKKRTGALHQREFIFTDSSIRIIDTILLDRKQSDKKHDAVARLHFHPDVNVRMVDHSVVADDIQIIQTNRQQLFKTEKYYYSPEFNQQISATVIEMPFSNKLDIEIRL